MSEREDTIISTMLSSEGIVSTVPLEFAEVLDNLYSADKSSADKNLAAIMFGEDFEEQEAEFILAYAYSIALEKKSELPESTHDDHEMALSEIERAERLEEAFKDPLAPASLKEYINDFFSNPKNVLRIGFLSLRGSNPVI